MPVLGLVRSPSVEHALQAAEIVLENGGMGHTSAVYATDETVIDAFATAVRTGRMLVNAPTAVGALGGVYNAMTPTFSLGCGTWGGSVTTENINYRNLLNIKAVSRAGRRRRSGSASRRTPTSTWLARAAAQPAQRSGAAGHRRRHRSARRRRRGAPSPRRLGAVFAEIEPEPTEGQVRAGVDVLEKLRPDLIVAVGGGSVLDAAKAMRLFHESPELTLAELTLPFLDARKRVAHYRRSTTTSGSPPSRPRRERARGLPGGRADRRRAASSRSSTTRSCRTSRSSSRG